MRRDEIDSLSRDKHQLLVDTDTKSGKERAESVNCGHNHGMKGCDQEPVMQVRIHGVHQTSHRGCHDHKYLCENLWGHHDAKEENLEQVMVVAYVKAEKFVMY